MRQCPTCKKEKKWREFAGTGSCRECNKKSCSVCGTIFCPTGKKTHCSNRCNLLGNIKKTDSHCWEWQKATVGPSNKFKYGIIKIHTEKRKVLAHRLSYEIFKGKFDPDLFVCHHCDNPLCINPEHLFLGTNLDNSQDSIKKGRQFPIRSVAHLRKGISHGGKLCPDDVKEIRKLRSEGIRRKVIAEKYGITPEHVWLIVTKKSWSHI